jgi:hypothetical protein
LVGSKLSDFRLIDECAHLNSLQVRELKQQFALLDVLALLDWN